MRPVERRVVDDGVRVEDNYVRPEPHLEHAAVGQRQTRRDRGARLADRVLERQHLLFPHIPPEEPREVAVGAGMRHAARRGRVL